MEVVILDEDECMIVENPQQLRDPLAISDDEQQGKKCKCRICPWGLKVFKRCSEREKCELIKTGRPTPEMKKMVFHTSKGHIKHFNTDLYSCYEWLTGCETRGKLFCWACILFSNKHSLWRKGGISDLISLQNSIKRHMNSTSHIDAMIKLKTYGKLGIDIPDIAEEEDQARFKIPQISRNREILKKLIRLVCFLCRNEIFLRERIETNSSDPIDNSKYVEFLNFLGSYDEKMKLVIEKQDELLSSRIRNQIIFSTTNIVYKRIKEEVSKASFVTLIFDEVAETEKSTLISTIVRFVTDRGDVRERFLNFQEVDTKRDANTFFEVVNKNVKFLDCASKVLCVSHDGAVVRSNELSIFQSNIKTICPKVLFLHYIGHNLSSVLAQSLSLIPECKHFFLTLNGIATTFLKSKRLTNELNSLINDKNIANNEFRWNFNGHLIKKIFLIRDALIELFKKVMGVPQNPDFQTLLESSGYFYTLKDDITFNLLLVSLADIFSRIENLFSFLLTRNYDIPFCVHKIQELNTDLMRKVDSFYLYYEEAIRLCTPEELGKEMKLNWMRMGLDVSASNHRKLLEEVMNDISIQIKARFMDFSTLRFIAAINFNKDDKNSDFNLEPCLASLSSRLGDLFDTSVLQSELAAITESRSVRKDSLRSMMKFFQLTELDSTVPQTMRLANLILSLPLSFNTSILDRVEAFVKNSNIIHHLSLIPLLTIEKDLVASLLEQPSFYEDVTREFAFREPSIPVLFS